MKRITRSVVECAWSLLFFMVDFWWLLAIVICLVGISYLVSPEISTAALPLLLGFIAHETQFVLLYIGDRISPFFVPFRAEGKRSQRQRDVSWAVSLLPLWIVLIAALFLTPSIWLLTLWVPWIIVCALVGAFKGADHGDNLFPKQGK